MKTADTSLINSYFSLLKSLSSNAKLELIAKLSQSMKTTGKAKDKSWKSLFGALELEIPIDKFVNDLKKDRNFTRKSLDL